MTVLANEQVIDGRGWRSGALVEQRDLTQWFFKITVDGAGAARRPRYARPLAGKSPQLMQQNWIGRSEGLLIRWPLAPGTAPAGETELEVYTTRPDTIFGASFMAIAADHPLASKAAAGNPALASFIDEVHHMGTSVAALETAEKKGFDTGIRVVHPFDPELDAAGLCRQFRADGLRHRRHLRLPVGRPARPRLRQQIRPAGGPGRDAGRRRRGDVPDHRRGLCRRRRDDQFALPRRHEAGRRPSTRWRGCSSSDRSATGRWPSARCSSACATG